MTDQRPPSDLEHAWDGYEHGLRLLATHPGPLVARLQEAAFRHLVNAGPWTRPPPPADMPAFLRPAKDMPDDVRERLRVVAADLTQAEPPTEARAAALAQEVVDLEVDLRARLADQRRRHVEDLVMAVTRDELQAPPSDEDLLRSGAWSEEHLIVLGRIVEVSASNEVTGRRLLGRAMGVPESNLGRRQYVDAVFLGSRLNDLSKRLVGLAQLEGLPAWLPAAVAWLRRAALVDERRNQLVHRPPALVMGATPSGRGCRRLAETRRWR